MRTVSRRERRSEWRAAHTCERERERKTHGNVAIQGCRVRGQCVSSRLERARCEEDEARFARGTNEGSRAPVESATRGEVTERQDQKRTRGKETTEPTGRSGEGGKGRRMGAKEANGRGRDGNRSLDRNRQGAIALVSLLSLFFHSSCRLPSLSPCQTRRERDSSMAARSWLHACATTGWGYARVTVPWEKVSTVCRNGEIQCA